MNSTLKKFLVFMLIAVLIMAGCASTKKSDDVNKNQGKTESGTYVGMIDGHTIEVKISGVPKEKATRAFQLSEQIISSWEKLKLKENDQIRFTYEEKNNMRIITSIEKISQ